MPGDYESRMEKGPELPREREMTDEELDELEKSLKDDEVFDEVELEEDENDEDDWEDAEDDDDLDDEDDDLAVDDEIDDLLDIGDDK